MFIERINIYERIQDLTIAKDGKIIVLSDGGDIIILSALKISP
jgi:glucose/arabinose dehydrogenase